MYVIPTDTHHIILLFTTYNQLHCLYYVTNTFSSLPAYLPQLPVSLVIVRRQCLLDPLEVESCQFLRQLDGVGQRQSHVTVQHQREVCPYLWSAQISTLSTDLCRGWIPVPGSWSLSADACSSRGPHLPRWVRKGSLS